MQRIQIPVNGATRLVQVSPATTITIWYQDGTLVVDAAATNQFGSFPIRYYDFTPPLWGNYLVRWNNAPIEYRWEMLEAGDYVLLELGQLPVKTVEKGHELPDAETG